MIRAWLVAAAALGLTACAQQERSALASLPEVPAGQAAVAAARVDGAVGTTTPSSTPQISIGRTRSFVTPSAAATRASVPASLPASRGGGDISLDFVDTDLREVVSQVLGNILRVNYTIDPAIRGTVTLRTSRPVSRAEVLPALQAVLGQNGAALVQSGGLYRVLPAAVANAATPGLAGSDPVTGAAVVPLRYASAEDLAKVLQPYVGAGGKIVPDAGQNALLVSGEPVARETLVALVRAFDTDALAGQSYALFPIGSGSAKEFATALQDAFRSQSGGALAGVVRVVPMERIGSVLLVSSQPRYIEEGRRLFGIVDKALQQTTRAWHVYYLQNSRANDTAYILQQAFTPNHVTAQPSRRALGTAARGVGTQGGFATGGGLGGGGLGGSGGLGGGGLGGGGLGGGGLGGYNASTGTVGGGALGGTGASGPAGALGTQIGGQDAAGAQTSANPLFGGLEPSAPGGQAGSQGADLNALRIIPDSQNNAVLVYATPRETDTVEAMLHKVDILPLQVRIDAVIAEVDLNDTLAYGTQFFFSAGISGALSYANPASAIGGFPGFASGFPGFVLSGPGGTSGALAALQAVTKVKVLSSPQIMVLDNEAARLLVGNLVPFLTSSSQSTLTNGAPIIHSVDYRETGVITDVTPRVNSGGLVTLDISQEVSGVVPGSANTSSASSTGISSPTFSDRQVTSRVVVQDGQTVGLAGLISDNASRQNSGIPFLKDIPLIGLLAGQQTNVRTRTELLVLITPHVVHDQRDARALTEDLRDQVVNAATVPADLGHLPPGGSPDPQRPLRRSLGLTP